MKKEIKTGLTSGANIEVLEGLANGDVVIIEGARSVQDGDAVEVVKK